MKCSCVWIGVWLLTSSLCLSVTHGNLVKNSGFEEGDTLWEKSSFDGTVLDTTTANDLFPVDAQHGSHYMYSNGGSAYQALADESGSFLLLQAGMTYTVGAEAGIPFYFSNFDDSRFLELANVTRTVGLFVLDDNSNPVIICNVTMPDWTSKDQCGTWQAASGNFTADASNLYLGKQLYVGFSTAGLQASWDNISVMIPEPVTLALIGLGGLFLARKR